ncbi:hypothetical protein [Burkholderia vietnamiensis]|uniref:hypothetical protein n=1 Tax=Burkholderia vietnamiensis TaxID=60552 RepID=UPI00158DC6F4|nr:hypothetical protein [Burkholderia vietnamiensis]
MTHRIELFHGTTPAIAKQLINCKVTVALGGGEFGRGFYLGTSRRLAKRRAFHKTQAVVGTAAQAMSSKDNTFQVTVDVVQLRTFYGEKLLDRNGARALFAQLKSANTTGSYSVAPNYDYVVGPVAGRKGRYLCVTQFKFDSLRSEKVLNKQCTDVTPVTSII